MLKVIKAGLIILVAMVIVSLALFGFSRMSFTQSLVGGNEGPQMYGAPNGSIGAPPQGMEHREGNGAASASALPGMFANLIKIAGGATGLGLIGALVEWLARKFKLTHSKSTVSAT